MRDIESPRLDRFGRPPGRFWLDLAWVGFALANLVAMALSPAWETVPFHLIWVSLTVLYGYRVWGLRVTVVLLTAVVASTGTLLLQDVVGHAQPADELVEVPLMGAMFLAMVWHAQRRRSAMEDLRQVSDANLRLLHRERQFIQDASHELRTPITVALGHAELVERASREPEVAEDTRIVVDELQRLRRLADRLLLLATSEDPDFLSRAPIEVEQLLHATLQRWAPVDRRWRLGPTEPATVVADADRLELAVDALVENAVKHTGPDDEILLGTRRQDGLVAIVVADSGAGMPPTGSTASSSASPGSTRPAAATWAGSASGSPSSRRSPRPTAARWRPGAHPARAASSSSCCPRAPAPARSMPVRTPWPRSRRPSAARLGQGR